MFSFHVRADENGEFVRMLNFYRHSGGLARKQEVVSRFEAQGGPDAATLDQWIDQREVICFDWKDQAWLPWFQFNRFNLAPHPQLRPVFAELNPAFDAWEMGSWFVLPNAWLAGRIPVDTLLSDLPAVLHAARADRFIANG